MTGIRWQDPPPPRCGTRIKHPRVHDWTAVAKKLRSKPGRWAVVAVCANTGLAGSTARYVRDGLYEALRRGRFEAVSRKVYGECRVYARYVGESP